MPLQRICWFKIIAMHDCKYKADKIKFNFKHIDSVRAQIMFLFRAWSIEKITWLQPNMKKKL